MTDTQAFSASSSPSAAIDSTPPDALRAIFERAFPGQMTEVVVRAPGRVNLLGGHVDMHGGAVINIAINREIWLAAARAPVEGAQIVAADLGEDVALQWAGLDEKIDAAGAALPLWALYPAGVAWALRRRGFEVGGIRAAFLGNVQMRAGLSSSAAVEEAFAIAWHVLAGWPLDLRELAVIGNEVEREYMGIGSGIQDQFTCLHARSSHALWLDCHTLDFRHMPLPTAATIVVCDTNTRRELAGSGYSGRARDGHDALRAIRAANPSVECLRDLTPPQLEAYQALLTPSQYRRARHVVSEIARVKRGAAALQAGDVTTFGRLMNESYFSARDDYGSSSPALDSMWEAVTRHPGCYGARYSGGGEAGVVVALVNRDAVADFVAAVSADYLSASGLQPSLFAVDPAAGASVRA